MPIDLLWRHVQAILRLRAEKAIRMCGLEPDPMTVEARTERKLLKLAEWLADKADEVEWDDDDDYS